MWTIEKAGARREGSGKERARVGEPVSIVLKTSFRPLVKIYHFNDVKCQMSKCQYLRCRVTRATFTTCFDFAIVHVFFVY